jgi:hypothetical protein
MFASTAVSLANTRCGLRYGQHWLKAATPIHPLGSRIDFLQRATSRLGTILSVAPSGGQII